MSCLYSLSGHCLGFEIENCMESFYSSAGRSHKNTNTWCCGEYCTFISLLAETDIYLLPGKIFLRVWDSGLIYILSSILSYLFNERVKRPTEFQALSML